jgi:NADPH2:quinone reductase
MREATRLVEEGKVKPLIDARRFTLDTALAAHELVESGKALGKIIVEIE